MKVIENISLTSSRVVCVYETHPGTTGRGLGRGLLDRENGATDKLQAGFLLV